MKKELSETIAYANPRTMLICAQKYQSIDNSWQNETSATSWTKARPF
jgi:hypothetical protein